MQRTIVSFFVLLVLGSLSFFSIGAQADTSPSLRISAESLKKELATHTEQSVILDTRSEEVYHLGHIQGAINFPINWTYQNKKANGKITDPSRMQSIFRNLGLNIDTPVIVYDDGSLVDAARLFWALEVYGLKHVKVLDTGFDYWSEKGYPVNGQTPKTKPSNYIAQVNQHRLSTKFSTLIATKNPNQIIIDARPEAAYLGEQSSAKRFGHIPKAINMPASHNFMHQQNIASLQPVNELKKIYANIPKGKKVIIYCAIGRISASNYLALRELGYDVSNYDASWKEWGNDFSLPIVDPAKSK